MHLVQEIASYFCLLTSRKQLFTGTSAGSRLEQGPEAGGSKHDPGVDRDVHRGKCRGHGRA
jgi:hypothetical protein